MIKNQTNVTLTRKLIDATARKKLFLYQNLNFGEPFKKLHNFKPQLCSNKTY